MEVTATIETSVKDSEKKDATSIANKLLERLKDQVKVEENLSEDEDGKFNW